MTQHLVRVCLHRLLTALIWLIALPAIAANDQALVWKVVTNNSQPLYLFGSIHLASPDFYPLRPAIMDAFENTDALVVEVNSQGQSQAMQQWLLEHAFFPEGQSIGDVLSNQTLQQLNDYCLQSGLPIEALSRQRPGLLAVTLTTLQLQRLGYRADLGLDQYFISHAGQRPILELETMEQQLQLLLSMGHDDLLIAQTLTELNQLDQQMNEMVQLWKDGNEQQLSRMLIDDMLSQHPEFAPIYQRLFDDRNVAMTRKISGYIDEGKSYFIVVGAGHLIGTKGIVSLLKQQGYQLQRL